MNSSIKRVGEALEKRDEEFIIELAAKQVKAGAKVLDVHTKDNADDMEWMVSVLQKAVDAPLSIDTDDENVLERALKTYKGKAIVNSITGEEGRLETFLPLIKEFDAEVIGLALDDKGIPNTSLERLMVCRKMLSKAEEEGIEKEKIYFDPLVLPLSVNTAYGGLTIETLKRIKNELDCRTTAGLTNISEGLLKRTYIDQAFLLISLQWLDSALMNPLDKGLMRALLAGNAVLGRDRYCRRYTRALRKVSGKGG